MPDLLKRPRVLGAGAPGGICRFSFQSHNEKSSASPIAKCVDAASQAGSTTRDDFGRIDRELGKWFRFFAATKKYCNKQVFD
jgi:hypothetical protein